ncbi:nicotinate-nucleotide adenylyltransferase [Pseudidiomarina salilacus]|uniref:nicotinate-nucleotide adenylyltransferase n=1 Tax=Pseudidiomarina salilacus TaxID=3384452 RepID=UPI003984F86E
MLRLIFGGTFDPIHRGHIETSLSAFQQLSAHCMHVVPSAQPPHRDYPGASATQRLRMTELAYAELPQVYVDDCELRREGPSYSLLTLQQMRAQWPDDGLVFLLGDDAFAKLDTWHGWQQLLSYAHLAVMQRPHHASQWSPAVQALYQQHRATTSYELHQRTAGHILTLATPAIDVSATRLRRAIANHSEWRHWVAPAVADYIHQQGLYLAK